MMNEIKGGKCACVCTCVCTYIFVCLGGWAHACVAKTFLKVFKNVTGTSLVA